MTSVAAFARTVVALRYDRRRAETERFSADERARMQRERLHALVNHVTANSPFYRRWYAERGVDEQASLTDLPVMDKATLMRHWDEIPTDRSLTLDKARHALRDGDGTVGRHHVFQTGGSSGEPAVYAYDRAASGHLIANFLRSPRFNGVGPRLPRRLRMSLLWAPGTIHMAARVSGLIDVGLYRMQRLPVSATIAEIATKLESHRPDILGGYPSVVAMIATAQLDGRCRIAPMAVFTSSEPLTAAHRERIRAAWDVEPFDTYATTETGPLAQECREHNGLHLYEDTVILEVEPDRVLVTNLVNRGFPMIRFAVEDLVTIDAEPCACGRTAPRLTSIAGRANEILDLPHIAGTETVAVHPSAWTPITALDPVQDAEIAWDGANLTIRAVPRPGATNTEAAVKEFAVGTLQRLQAAPARLRVEVVDQLPRSATGKRQLVRRISPRPTGLP